MQLKKIVDGYMGKVSGLKEHCDRCLRSERWSGSVVLMVVDAAFTSIGLNYFTAVVPKVEEFKKIILMYVRFLLRFVYKPIKYLS